MKIPKISSIFLKKKNKKKLWKIYIKLLYPLQVVRPTEIKRIKYSSLENAFLVFKTRQNLTNVAFFGKLKIIYNNNKYNIY